MPVFRSGALERYSFNVGITFSLGARWGRMDCVPGSPTIKSWPLDRTGTSTTAALATKAPLAAGLISRGLSGSWEDASAFHWMSRSMISTKPFPLLSNDHRIYLLEISARSQGNRTAAHFRACPKTSDSGQRNLLKSAFENQSLAVIGIAGFLGKQSRPCSRP